MEISKQFLLQSKLSEIDNGHFSNTALSCIRQNFSRKFQTKLIEMYNPKEFSSQIRQIQQQIDSQILNICEDFGHVGLSNLSHRLSGLFDFYHIIVRFLSDRCMMYFERYQELKEKAMPFEKKQSEYCVYCMRTIKLQRLKFLEKPFQKGTIDNEEIERLRVEDDRRKMEIEELQRMELYAEGSESYLHNLKNLLEQKDFYLHKDSAGTIEKLQQILYGVTCKQQQYLNSQLKSIGINFQQNGMEVVSRITSQICRRIRVLIDKIFHKRVNKLCDAMCTIRLQELKQRQISTAMQTQDWKVIDSIKMLEYRNEALTRMLLSEKTRVSELEKEMMFQLKRCEEIKQQKIVLQKELEDTKKQLQMQKLSYERQVNNIGVLESAQDENKQFIIKQHNQIIRLKDENYEMENQIEALQVNIDKMKAKRLGEDVGVHAYPKMYNVQVQVDNGEGKVRFADGWKNSMSGWNDGTELYATNAQLQSEILSSDSQESDMKQSIMNLKRRTSMMKQKIFNTLEEQTERQKNESQLSTVKSRKSVSKLKQSQQKLLLKLKSEKPKGAINPNISSRKNIVQSLLTSTELKKNCSTKNLLNKTNKIIEIAEKSQREIEIQNQVKQEKREVQVTQKAVVRQVPIPIMQKTVVQKAATERHRQVVVQEPIAVKPQNQLKIAPTSQYISTELPFPTPPKAIFNKTLSKLHLRSTTLQDELSQIHEFQKQCEASKQDTPNTSSQSDGQIEERANTLCDTKDAQLKQDLNLLRKIKPKLMKQRFSSFRIAQKFMISRASNLSQNSRGSVVGKLDRNSMKSKKSTKLSVIQNSEDIELIFLRLATSCRQCLISSPILDNSLKTASHLTQLTLALRDTNPQAYLKIVSLLKQRNPFMLALSFMRITSLHGNGCEVMKSLQSKITKLANGDDQ